MQAMAAGVASDIPDLEVQTSGNPRYCDPVEPGPLPGSELSGSGTRGSSDHLYGQLQRTTVKPTPAASSSPLAHRSSRGGCRRCSPSRSSPLGVGGHRPRPKLAALAVLELDRETSTFQRLLRSSISLMTATDNITTMTFPARRASDARRTQKLPATRSDVMPNSTYSGENCQHSGLPQQRVNLLRMSRSRCHVDHVVPLIPGCARRRYAWTTGASATPPWIDGIGCPLPAARS